MSTKRKRLMELLLSKSKSKLKRVPTVLATKHRAMHETRMKIERAATGAIAGELERRREVKEITLEREALERKLLGETFAEPISAARGVGRGVRKAAPVVGRVSIGIGKGVAAIGKGVVHEFERQEELTRKAQLTKAQRKALERHTAPPARRTTPSRQRDDSGILNMPDIDFGGGGDIVDLEMPDIEIK